MKYRPHRGILADAMKESVELSDRDALYRHIQQTEGDGTIVVARYMDGPDERIGWKHTRIVLLNGTPVGFCEWDW